MTSGQAAQVGGGAAPAVRTRRGPRLSSAVREAVAVARADRDQHKLPLDDLPPRKKGSPARDETRGELLDRLLDPELTLAEAAKVLEVCPATVRRYADKGVLSHHRTPGNQRRFKLRDVLDFLARKDLSVVQAEDGS